MAKINFGEVVNDARGKIAGIVFSKNKSGAYTRTKVTPVNPNSPAQQAVRSFFAQLAQNWSAVLTAAQRAAWTAYAVTYPRTDIFGNSLTLNGMNMYIALNSRLLLTGNALINTPPLTNAVNPAVWGPNFPACSLIALTVQEIAPSSDASAWNFLFCTKSLPPGRSPSPSDYRFVYAAVDPGAAGALDVFSHYAAVFGTPVLGGYIYGLISTLDVSTGLMSVGQPIYAIVT